VAAPAVWGPDSGAAIRTRAAPPYEYTVVDSESPPYQGPLCVPPDPLELARDSAIPLGLDPGVRRLALSIGGKLALPQAKISAVVGYLMSHYSYSLTIHPGPGDPVSNFLLHKKAAYCEYFGSAAVILLRYLGVPSRYVVGYYAHEADGPNVTVVRQWDAHAWAEAWVSGVGWVTVDATPADGRPDQLDHTVPFWTRMLEWFQDHSAAWRAELRKLSPGEIAGIVAGTALAGLLIRWLWLGSWRLRQRRRARQAEFRYSPADQDLERLAAAFERFLARSGLACPSEMTWQECVHVARTADSPPPIDTDAALAFIDEYNRVRFGRQADAGPASRLHETLAKLEETKR
jgi:transglutaminase-like putative cysteine protease